MSTAGTAAKGNRTSGILGRITNNDRTAVADFRSAHGDLVWSIARNFTETPDSAEHLALNIFGDIWKYAHCFEASGLNEQVFISLIAKRRLSQQPVITKTTFGSDNRFFKSFHRYANGDNA